MANQEMRGALAREIAAILAHPHITAEHVLEDFTNPPGLNYGHLSLPCFRLAKILDLPSQDLARRIAEGLSAGAPGAPGTNDCQVTAAGPYANFRWHVPALYRRVMERVFAEKETYGADGTGSGQTVLLEYGSPNIARSLAFSHLRSTLVGNTLANVYAFLGYRTERICFVGDWGSQFARLLAAVELWGDKELIARGGTAAIDHLSELQSKYQKAAETDSTYSDRAIRYFQALEEKDPKVSALWRQLRDLSLAEAERTLRRLHIRFDHLEGESSYIDAIPALVEDVKQRADARASDGAWIVDVAGCPTPALIQKRDGTTLYFTRDLAAAIDRQSRFRPYRSYYIVSEAQRLHFQLLFGVLEKMGYDWANRCEHLPFAAAQLPAEKKTLEQVLDEARDRALAECVRKNPDLVDKDEVAEKVGMAALIFGELCHPRAKPIEFQWESALALEDGSGPYVQYACVRCQALAEKARAKGEPAPAVGDAPEGYVFGVEEEALLVDVARFGAVLHQVTRENEPSVLAQYLIELAKSFNRFYYRFPVLQANDAAQRRMRLSLAEATRQTLSNGLRLLGIDCPRQM